MITADTITDEQIREIRERAERNHVEYGLQVDADVATIANRALGLGTAWKPFGLDRNDARARCAEILTCAHQLVEVLSVNGRNLDGAVRVCACCGAGVKA